VSLEQRQVVDAAPLITATGNMAQRKTGNWRIHRPEIDYTACNHCQICYARCPEGVIEADPEGKPVIDYDHCKGCMICAQECPKHAIRTLWEMDYASQ
jgi:pyruvate ferredoxin oxidoreductase gamma subunit